MEKKIILEWIPNAYANDDKPLKQISPPAASIPKIVKSTLLYNPKKSVLNKKSRR